VVPHLLEAHVMQEGTDRIEHGAEVFLTHLASDGEWLPLLPEKE